MNSKITAVKLGDRWCWYVCLLKWVCTHLFYQQYFAQVLGVLNVNGNDALKACGISGASDFPSLNKDCTRNTKSCPRDWFWDWSISSEHDIFLSDEKSEFMSIHLKNSLIKGLKTSINLLRVICCKTRKITVADFLDDFSYQVIYGDWKHASLKFYFR